MKTYECPRCAKEKEVNSVNFILGEEMQEFTEDGEEYHVYLDAHTVYGDFVCRECVLELIGRYLEMSK